MLEKINSVICGAILPITLLAFGIYFLVKLKGFFILHPIRTFKDVFSGKSGAVSLCVALSGTLGVGNIVGVASAIIAGGAGAVFWMIMSAFVAMGLKYAEVSLAMKYRRYTDDGYIGGAPYYINDGLRERFGINGRGCGVIFALLCIINSLSTGNLVQINAVSSSLPVEKFIFCFIFALCVLIVIIGGGKRIRGTCTVLIPILTFLYVFVSLYIIISNYQHIPAAFTIIFKEAFSFRSAVSGFCGYGIASAMRYGISRGLLSNEAGCGTSPCAHAESQNNAHSQGCFGILEVFIDTTVLCTLTALVIILSGTVVDDAMKTVVLSFSTFLGKFGEYFIILSCLFFAFATVICQYYYAEKSLNFITNRKSAKIVFSVFFILICALCAFIPMDAVWQISDLVIAIMAIVNILFLFALYK